MSVLGLARKAPARVKTERNRWVDGHPEPVQDCGKSEISTQLPADASARYLRLRHRAGLNTTGGRPAERWFAPARRQA
jgi:hypothetical protein